MKCKGIKMRSRILLVLLLLTINLFAVKGEIRVELQSHKNLYTSQKIIVAVELMTDAFSISDARITFPSSLKYIVNAPKSATYISTEEINGTDWQMVHYEYEVYALQAGEIEVSSVKATFSASMGYGRPKKEFSLQSKALHYSVLSPKGIKKDQFVLVTDNYRLSQKIEPQKSELIVGDAIEVELTQKAHAVPDILLKQIHYKSTALLRMYEKEPLLKSGIQGKYDVSRTDRFTFVATAEGNVSIPEQKIVWWDSKSEKVMVETISAMHFSIIADPQIALDAQDAKEKKFVMYIAVIGFILLLLYHFFAPTIKARRIEEKLAFESSEEGKYARLQRSVKNADIPLMYTHFYDWIGSIIKYDKPQTIKDVYEQYPQFKDACQSFEEALLNPDSLKQRKCLKTLETLRSILLESEQENVFALGKSLNP